MIPLLLLAASLCSVLAGVAVASYSMAHRWRQEAGELAAQNLELEQALAAWRTHAADLERIARRGQLQLLPLEEFDLELEPISDSEGTRTA